MKKYEYIQGSLLNKPAMEKEIDALVSKGYEVKAVCGGGEFSLVWVIMEHDGKERWTQEEMDALEREQRNIDLVLSKQ